MHFARMSRILSVSFAFVTVLSFPVRADIVVGGDRPVTVHVPPSYDPAVPTPLIILLHGYDYDGPGMENMYGMKPLADSEGFLHASPNGTLDPCGSRFWNATNASGRWVCGGADIDDVGYLLGLVKEIQSHLNVDTRRIHFMGWSNGGFMSYRMACEYPHLIAAIASIAGATFNDPAACQPQTPVHVLQVHGTLDGSNFYGGGTRQNGATYPGAAATVERWAQNNGCSLVPAEGGATDLCSTFPGEETQVTRYVDGCGSGGSAELWTVVGAGHPVCLGVGDSSFSAGVVKFLLSHPKTPVPEASFSTEIGGGPAPLEARLDGSASTTPKGTTITLYQWDFGDGTSAESTTPLASHTYTEPARYLITLTIRTNDEGRIDREQRTVDVFCPSGDIAPWTGADIGEPLYHGSARPGEGGGRVGLRLCAGGYTLKGASDQCFFVYKELRGDFVLTAHVSDLKSKVIGDEVGLMFRESLQAGSRFAAIVFRTQTMAAAPSGRFVFKSRATSGQLAAARNGGIVDTLDVWLQLERRGNVFRGSSSIDGQTWTPIPERELRGLPEALLGGVVAVGTDTPGAIAGFEPLETGVSVEATSMIPEVTYRRGLVNADVVVDLSDAVFLLGHLFLGEPKTLGCDKSADFNDDGALDISDPVSLLSYLFLGKPEMPAEPFTACGVDPTPDSLGCPSSPNCE